MDVNHPDEIGTLFDGAIVYAKGARLMGMMRHYIGGEVFQEGLTDYFKKHAYGNTEAKDLWLAFEGHSDKHIADFMSTWISQPGYPVVHVSRVNNQITLTQERLSSPSSPKSDSIWPIPLNSNCADIPEILESRTTTISTDFNQPIRLNVGNFGHFITHYDDEMFDEILELVQSGQLSSVDRLQFLNEQTLLARAGIIDSARLISILDAYKNETVEPVWDVMAMAAGELRKFVESDDEAEAKLRQLYGKLARQQFDRLGWNEQEGETESDTKLRSLIISMMIYSEDADTLTHAFELFRTTDTDKLDPEIRSLIIATAIRHQETDEMVENLINTYKKSNSSELRNDITGGLTSTRNPNTIKKLLTALKDTKTFKTQDTFRWIANLLRNKHARNLTWEWVRSNWKWINEHFGGDKSYDDYPRYSASSLLTRTQLQEYKDFFQPLKSDPSLSRVIEMGINEITDRVELIERDGNSVRNTLLNL
jgi:aminopeptidase N